MTIRFKILVGCLGLTLMTALLGLYDQSVEQQLGDLGVGLYDNAFQAMSYLRAAQNDLLVASALPEQAATQRLRDALDNIAVAEQRALSAQGHAASAELRGRLVALSDLPGGQRAPAFAAAQDAFDTAVEIYGADGYHLRRVVGDVLVSTRRDTFIAIGLSLAAAVAIIALISRSVLPALRKAVGIAQSIAAGRLDNPIRPRGRSETALLLRALEQMQSAISLNLAENRGLLDQQAAAHASQARHQSEVDAVVQRFGSSMGGVFRIVSGASVEMAVTADGLVGDAEALLRTERDVRQQIEQVVARIGSASQSSRLLSEAIFGISAETAQTEQRARATLEATQAATERMGSLGRAADEITSVADMIGALAAQTKLLALNASIEAARAGSAGAGFAVVAQEVKRLADQSAQAAQIVGQRIASILEAADASRAAIEVIALSTHDVHRQSASIAKAVALQDAACTAMSTNVSEIMENAGNVEQSLGTIGDLTRTGAGNLRGIASEAKTVSQNAADLSREVSAFLEFVRGIKPGELTRAVPVVTAARLTLGGANFTGRATFTSDLALSFEPPVAAEIGVTGVLLLTATGATLAVRVAQTDAAATYLQPPLTTADRLRLHDTLDLILGDLIRGDLMLGGPDPRGRSDADRTGSDRTGRVATALTR